MLRRLGDAVPEIIAILVTELIGEVIGVLRPEWRLVARLSALCLTLAVLSLSPLVRRVCRAKQRRAREDEYLESVVSKYQVWKERYLQLGVVPESPILPVWDDITIHPAMYMLLEEGQHIESGEGSSSAQRQEKKVKVHLPDIPGGRDQVVLLGEPGSGKSTQLQWLALHCARVAACSPRGAHTLPLLIELSRYTTDETVEEFLSRCLREDDGKGGEFLAEHLAEYLDTGEMMFLFDGLNEMPADGYRDRIDRLRSFAGRWRRNKFIFSCRTLDYEYRFGWPRVVIAPLEEAQVEEFVTRYLPETGTQLMQELRAGDRALLDLARNPFMLRMMILVYEREGRLPSVRSRLMDEFARCLLAREKGEAWPGTAKAEQAVAGLAHLAFAMTEQGHVGTEVARTWAESVLSNRNVLGSLGDGLAGADLLKLAADSSLLVVSRSRDTVQYYHQLLQDYLSALVLKGRWEAGDDLSSLLSDTWWDAVVALACGLVGNPDDLVAHIGETQGPQRGALFAARCCAEAGPALRPSTLRAVIESLHPSMESEIGPLGMQAMDLAAQIDRSYIERLVLQPDRDWALDPELQVVDLMGARYGGIVPTYVGPFFHATRDRLWEPRPYAASILREVGSQEVTGLLLRVLRTSSPNSIVYLRTSGALAAMATPDVVDSLLRVFEMGPTQSRCYAVQGLAKAGASETEPVLTRALLDPSEDRQLRYACADALLILAGPIYVERLERECADVEVRRIIRETLSQWDPPSRDHDSADECRLVGDSVELLTLDPPELLRCLLHPREDEGCSVLHASYPVALTLALKAEESFVPHLEAALRSCQGPVHPWASFNSKVREALWWTIEAIRDKRRRRTRTPKLSPYPRDWSAFGAPPR